MANTPTTINSPEGDMPEIPRTVWSQLSDEVMLNYHEKLSDALEKQGVFSELDEHRDVPLEFWAAFAQTLADASGYRVTFQAAVTEPIPHTSGGFRITGYREETAAEPSTFQRTYSQEVARG